MYYLNYRWLLGKELLCLFVLSLPLGRILKCLVVFGSMLIFLNQWLSNMMTNLSFLCRPIGLLLQIPLMREPIAGSVKGHRVCRQASFTLGCMVSVLSFGTPKGKITRECHTFVSFLVESLYDIRRCMVPGRENSDFPFFATNSYSRSYKPPQTGFHLLSGPFLWFCLGKTTSQ